MTVDGRRWAIDGSGIAPLVGRSSSLLLVAFALALFAGAGACVGLAALAAQRVDLLHAVLFSQCQMRSYALHWQNVQRLPRPFHYDFTMSPDSFILLEVWFEDGPTLSLSQRLPVPCW